ncbi:MAG: tRNA preQ1(34) S-adenosylmethionine ribosyltransferase-isomerase QueA [Thermodesulfobacteriota bacterium]
MFALSDYHYHLPEECIAQAPAASRGASRLLFLDRAGGKTAHHRFDDITRLLKTGDILVLNDTRVVPGRLFGRKDSGGMVEALLLDYAGGMEKWKDQGVFECQCLVRASKGVKIGGRILFDEGLEAVVADRADNLYTLRFSAPAHFGELLDRIGHTPLPPYIKRKPGAEDPRDRDAYQTVYASRKGAIAAPTAGLHFSDALLETIRAMGVKIAVITLHVGYGTFLPVREEDIRRHRMHAERYAVSSQAAEAVNETRKQGGRVVAVGTTAVRTLEHLADPAGHLSPGTGLCELFIYPGYRFRIVDAMVTNFHLPQSTLLMLVSAFAGRDLVLQVYTEAVRLGYRFFSYGDAMLIA